MKVFYTTVAIIVISVIVLCINYLAATDEGTYFIKQNDIAKIEAAEGMHLKIVEIKDTDLCNDVKAVTIEGHYYFGGNPWTTTYKELEHLGLTYYK